MLHLLVSVENFGFVAVHENAISIVLNVFWGILHMLLRDMNTICAIRTMQVDAI